MAKLQFKFRSRRDAKGRRQVLSFLEKLEVAVRPLFPDDDDAELSNLYVAEVGDDAAVTRALAYLKRHKTVEFAEPAVRRKLIR